MSFDHVHPPPPSAPPRLNLTPFQLHGLWEIIFIVLLNARNQSQLGKVDRGPDPSNDMPVLAAL